MYDCHLGDRFCILFPKELVGLNGFEMLSLHTNMVTLNEQSPGFIHYAITRTTLRAYRDKHAGAH